MIGVEFNGGLGQVPKQAQEAHGQVGKVFIRRMFDGVVVQALREFGHAGNAVGHALHVGESVVVKFLLQPPTLLSISGTYLTSQPVQ